MFAANDGCTCSDDTYDFNRKAEEVAELNGCVVVYPEPNQLQIDLDTDEQYQYYKKRLEDVERILEWDMSVKETPSKSGLPHRHITITVKDKVFTEWERIACQVMLGSDPVREGLNTLRMCYGVENPTRLFELKIP
jgi:hypothetical protein